MLKVYAEGGTSTRTTGTGNKLTSVMGGNKAPRANRGQNKTVNRLKG